MALATSAAVRGTCGDEGWISADAIGLRVSRLPLDGGFSCIGQSKGIHRGSSWPQFRRGPLPGVLHVRIPVPSSLLRIADVRLLDLVRPDDDDAEVAARNRIVEILDLVAQLQAVVRGRVDGLTGRRCSERACRVDR
jgi:hypothetical protein